jgi:hypothetical protein
MRPATAHAAEMRATDVRTSTSHSAKVTAAAEMTTPAEMRAATAVTASAASRRRIGHTRNHDRENDNGQEIEF